MKKFLLITTIAFVTIAAAPVNSKGTALAAADNSSAQQASDVGPASKTAPTEEKRICKLLPTTGTRMAKSACLTAKEWKQVEADVQDDNGY